MDTILSFIYYRSEYKPYYRKGEATIKNIFIVAIMYFTYSQLWLFVAIKGMIEYLKDIIFKREVKWYKTERF